MPNSSLGWLGLLMVFTLFSAMALLLVGIAMDFVPGMRPRAQQFMRAGATIALGFIFFGGILSVLIGDGNAVDWKGLGLLSLFAFVTFCVPWLWKRFTQRG